MVDRRWAARGRADGAERSAGRELLPPDTALPLTVLDEYPWHQAPAPFPMPAAGDPRFNDGYYFGFFAEGFFAFLGLRLYPNNNVIDGYAGVGTAGEQRVVRASRALRPAVEELEVGPLGFEIVEPMKSQRLWLGENETGVSYEVEIEASTRAFFESPDIHYRQGRLMNHVLRYTQMGRAAGEIRVDGDATAIDGWYAARDHSWGIRQSMGPRYPIKGVDAEARDPRALRLWMPFEAGDQHGMISMHEDGEGNLLDFDGHLFRGEEEIELVAAEHDFEYVEGSKRLRKGAVTLIDAEGARHEYTFEVVADPVSPQGYGYVKGWGDGGQPGAWRGEEHVEHDRFSIGDPAEVSGPDHVPVERRLGACEFAARVTAPDGGVGMAQIEHMIYRAYRPYGFSS